MEVGLVLGPSHKVLSFPHILSMARADEIKPGSLYIDSLRVYRLRELEAGTRPLFDKAIGNHFHRTMQEAQRYLDNFLRQKGVEVRRL